MSFLGEEAGSSIYRAGPVRGTDSNDVHAWGPGKYEKERTRELEKHRAT